MVNTTTDIRPYELMVILSGDLPDGDYEKTLAEIRKIIQEGSKAITHEDIWGRKDLAYRLKRQARGYYAIFHFSAGAENIKELRSNIKLHPTVLRHLLIAIPESYVPGRYNEIVLREEKSAAEKAAIQRKSDGKKLILEKKALPEKEGVAPALAGKQEEEQLKKVEKKLEQILENPDIDIR